MSLNPNTINTHGYVLKERWHEVVAAPWTSSRWLSHVLWLKVHGHLLLRACLLGSKRKLPPLVRSDLDFPLWSAFQGACSSLALCTSVVRVLCQVLEPTAFLMHPVLAAVAEDAVAAHSSATDGAWKLSWTLQEIQTCTADHDLCLFYIYSQSFLFHCFFTSQEPSDTFLERFSDDKKVIGIEVLPEDSRAEISWKGFKHNDKEKWAEYWALVNTDLHNKLFTVPLTNWPKKSSRTVSKVYYQACGGFDCMGSAMLKLGFGHMLSCGQWRPRSACTVFAVSKQNHWIL